MIEGSQLSSFPASKQETLKIWLLTFIDEFEDEKFQVLSIQSVMKVQTGAVYLIIPKKFFLAKKYKYKDIYL